MLSNNYDELSLFCNKNNIQLIGEYNNTIKKRSNVTGNCITNNCTETFTKTLDYLYKYNGYCKTCANKNRIINSKKTFIEKYGVENPFASEVIKNKIKITNLHKYGVENVNYSKEIIENKKKNCLHKYGYTSTLKLENVINKRKEACIKKYGSEFVLQSKKGQENLKRVCLQKYGVENPQHCPEIAEKSSKKSYYKKTYTFPSGNQINCQGYEPFALNILLEKENINETDIVTGCQNVPKIVYLDENNKEHRHYVDIFIPSQNRCIEVKSTWTAKKKQDNIYLKKQAGENLGYKYDLWIFDQKGNLQIE